MAVARRVAFATTRLAPGRDGLDPSMPKAGADGRRAWLEQTVAGYEWASIWCGRRPHARAELERMSAELSSLGVDTRAPVGDCAELRAALVDRVQLEREYAVFDLTDAAQAAIQASLADAGSDHLAAERHDENSARLYACADYHRALACGIAAELASPAGIGDEMVDDCSLDA